MKIIIQRLLFGIAWGCTILVFVDLVGVAIAGESFLAITAQEYVKQAVCSMIVGVGFSIPTIVYYNDKLSKGIQVLIHMGIGLTIYFIVAFSAGWIPVKYGFGVSALTVVIALVLSFAIWSCFWWYYKNEAKIMNEQIKNRQGE